MSGEEEREKEESKNGASKNKKALIRTGVLSAMVGALAFGGWAGVSCAGCEGIKSAFWPGLMSIIVGVICAILFGSLGMVVYTLVRAWQESKQEGEDLSFDEVLNDLVESYDLGEDTDMAVVLLGLIGAITFLVSVATCVFKIFM